MADGNRDGAGGTGGAAETGGDAQRRRGGPAPPVPPEAFCPGCRGSNLRSHGRDETPERKRRYRCRDCGRCSRGVADPVRTPIPAKARCTHCGGKDLGRWGKYPGKKAKPRYQCRTCGAQTAGTGLRPPPPANPCPYCRGRCITAGKRRRGRRQRYKCLSCGRTNTGLWPRPTAKPTELALVRRSLCLNLDVPAHQKLIAYCQNAQLTSVEAVRTIFRDAARGMAVVTMASAPRRVFGEGEGGADGGDRRRGSAPPSYRPRFTLAEAEAALASFPDRRGEYTRARLIDGRGNPRHLSVAVMSKVSVRLDPAAVEGLVRVMEAKKWNHQQAARWLIANARVPERRPTIISEELRALFAGE